MAETSGDRFRLLAEAATKQVFESSFPSLQRMLKTVDDAIQENLSASANVEQAMDEFESGLDQMNTNLVGISSLMKDTISLLKKVSEIIEKNSGKSFLQSLFGAKDAAAKGAATKAAEGASKSNLVAPAAALGGGALLGGALASKKGEDKKPIEKRDTPPGDLLNLPTEEKNKVAQSNDAQKQPSDTNTPSGVTKTASIPTGQTENKNQPAAPVKLSQNESNVFKNLSPNYKIDDFKNNKDATPLADLPSANAREVSYNPESSNKTSESIDELRESKEAKYKASIIEFLAGSIVFNDKSKRSTGFGWDSLDKDVMKGPGSTPGGGGGSGAIGAPGGEGSKGNEKDSELKSNPKLAQVTTASGKKANVAKEYADRFQGFIKDLEATGYKINDIGGYNFRRNVNNPSKMSMHAYGAAVDINPANNPNGTTKTDLPPETNEIAKKWGLGWGMNWTSVKDPMHFSAAAQEGGSQPMGEPIRSSKSPNVAETTPGDNKPATSSSKPAAEAPSASVGPKLNQTSTAVSDSAPPTPPKTTVNNIDTQGSPQGGPQNPKLADSRIAGPVEPADSASRYAILFDMINASLTPGLLNG